MSKLPLYMISSFIAVAVLFVLPKYPQLNFSNSGSHATQKTITDEISFGNTRQPVSFKQIEAKHQKQNYLPDNDFLMTTREQFERPVSSSVHINHLGYEGDKSIQPVSATSTEQTYPSAETYLSALEAVSLPSFSEEEASRFGVVMLRSDFESVELKHWENSNEPALPDVQEKHESSKREGMDKQGYSLRKKIYKWVLNYEIGELSESAVVKQIDHNKLGSSSKERPATIQKAVKSKGHHIPPENNTSVVDDNPFVASSHDFKILPSRRSD